MKPKVLTAVLLGSTMASVGGSAYLAGLSPPLLSHLAAHLAAPGPLVAAPAPVDAPAAVTSRPSPPTTSPPTPVSSRHPVPSPPSARAGPEVLPGQREERTRAAHGQPSPAAATTVPALVIVATVTYTVQKGDTLANIGRWFAGNGEAAQFRDDEPSIRDQLRRLVPGTLISISNGKASVQLPWPGAVLKPVHPLPPPDQAVEHAP